MRSFIVLAAVLAVAMGAIPPGTYSGGWSTESLDGTSATCVADTIVISATLDVTATTVHILYTSSATNSTPPASPIAVVGKDVLYEIKSDDGSCMQLVSASYGNTSLSYLVAEQSGVTVLVVTSCGTNMCAGVIPTQMACGAGGVCTTAQLYADNYQMAGFANADPVCTSYCNHFTAFCSPGQADGFGGSFTACHTFCMGFVQGDPTTALSLPYEQQYNSIACRAGFAALAETTGALCANAGMGANPAVGPGLCVNPAPADSDPTAIPCTRLCQGLVNSDPCMSADVPVFGGATAYQDCLDWCGPVFADSYANVPPVTASGSPVNSGDNFWCRYYWWVGSQIQQFSGLCDIAGPTGTGALMADIPPVAQCQADLTSNFVGLWQVVPGYCTPGAALGQCCCFQGTENVTTYNGGDLLHDITGGYNMIYWQAPVSGGAACLGSDVLNVPMFIQSSVHAQQSFYVPSQGVTLNFVIEIDPSRNDNQYRVYIDLLKSCGADVCRDPDGDCKPPGSSSSTGGCTPETCGAASLSSSFALLAALAAAVVAYVAY